MPMSPDESESESDNWRWRTFTKFGNLLWCLKNGQNNTNKRIILELSLQLIYRILLIHKIHFQFSELQIYK